MTAHWLREPGATSTPQRVATLTTETTSGDSASSRQLRLRCWALIVRDRQTGSPEQSWTVTETGETPVDLAGAVTGLALASGDLWVWVGTAGVDLTVTMLPHTLCEAGWTPSWVQLGDETCVLRFKLGGVGLTITDTWSWLHGDPATVARGNGRRVVKDPDTNAPLSRWLAHCTRRAEVLDELMGQVLDWHDEHGSGKFAPTGGGNGWGTLRARVPSRSVLVGSDPDRTPVERQALYGGRREVFRVGRFRVGRVDDWDIARAHLTTMRDLPLPTRPVGRSKLTAGLSPIDPPDGLGCLIEATVTTDRPCCPVRIAGDVWWPTGTMRTTLTTPELRYVLSVASKVQLHTSRWYELTDDLSAWAEWCGQLEAGQIPGTPAVMRRVAKGWSRSVPGRFALRTSQLAGERPASEPDWTFATGHDLQTGAVMDVVTWGGIEHTFLKDRDGPDCLPIVLAWIEGHVRAALGRTIDSRELGSVLQCNTDGWWELRQPKAHPLHEPVAPEPYTLVRKATSTDVEVIGPCQVTTPAERRIAGVPPTATVDLDGRYKWVDSPGLRYQLEHSRRGVFTMPRREMQLANHYCRRWVLSSGWTVPPACEWTAPAGNRLLPWALTPLRPSGAQLASWQVPGLAELAGESPSRSVTGA